MRKALIVLSILMVVGFVSAFAYAGSWGPATQPASANTEDRGTWFNERMEWKRDQVNTALNEGLIGEEEAETWNEHFQYMEKFHRNNGFMPGCHGVGTGPGYGRRTMRGYRWNK